jgi:hypothetical protein
MADNTTLNAATVGGGDVISTDQLIANLLGVQAKVQNVKEAFGYPDAMTQVTPQEGLPTREVGDITKLILVELRLQSILMAQAFGIRDDLNELRTTELTTISTLT